MPILFQNRTEAGQMLGRELTAYTNHADLLVLGLPRGGVPVAFEVAKLLNAPLDICLVRKLGVPGNKELAMGAIASGGIRVLNQDLVNSLGISEQIIDEVAAAPTIEDKSVAAFAVPALLVDRRECTSVTGDQSDRILHDLSLRRRV